MDKSKLQDRREQIEQQFNALQKEKQQLNQRNAEIDAECNILKGRYEELGELIEQTKPKKDKANVIEVKEK